MSDQIYQEKTERVPIDYTFLIIVILLVGFGLSLLFSASYYRAELLFDNPYYFLKNQFLRLVLGVVLAIVASRVPLETICRFLPLIILFSFGLLILTFIPGLGVNFLGANRWIVIFGVSFQPSELVKVSLILYLSYILSRKKDKLHDPLNSLLPPFIIVVVFVGLVYLQNDFSTALFLLLISLLMFFIAKIRVTYFLVLIALGLPVTAILLFTKEHRVRRLIAFLEPGVDPSGSGFQIIASKAALARGGFWGTGIGQSVKKFGGLPEAHSDFVFAVAAEELGYLGVVLIVGLFVAFAIRGYSIAWKQQSLFGYYLAFGITSSIFLQALLNIAVVSGIIPATGVPLPFFSSGGSAILMTLIMCGLMLNVSRFREDGEVVYGR